MKTSPTHKNSTLGTEPEVTHSPKKKNDGPKMKVYLVVEPTQLEKYARPIPSFTQGLG